MSTTTQLIIIIGMAIVTAGPRIAPLLFLSSRDLPQPVLHFLEMIPPAVLSALLAQEVILSKTPEGVSLYISVENIHLIAVIPTIIVGLIGKNFFVTVVAGMLSVALLRYFAPF